MTTVIDSQWAQKKPFVPGASSRSRDWSPRVAGISAAPPSKGAISVGFIRAESTSNEIGN